MMVSHLENAFNHIKLWDLFFCLFGGGRVVALLPCGFTGGRRVKVGKTECITDDVHPSISRP